MRLSAVALSGGVPVSVAEAGAGPVVLLMRAGVSDRHRWDP